jgi:fumarate hydratase class I
MSESGKNYVDLEAAIWGGLDSAGIHERFEAIEGLKPKGFGLNGGQILRPSPRLLQDLSARAFHDIAFYQDEEELEGFRKIALDPGSSPAERFVAQSLIKNAIVASAGEFPLCQDTGTATCYAWRGNNVLSDFDEAAALAEGARSAYADNALRYSQVVPSTVYQEKNSGNNLPAQIEISHSPRPGYRFLFVAKGGGSSNKTFFFQETKALLNPASLREFLKTNVPKLGVSACPPYHLAVAIGGTSPELNLKALKLATTGYVGGGLSGAGLMRDKETEELVMQVARETGLGAQFKGSHLAMAACVLRLPRHAASCPVSIGVSCNAHRNVRAYMDDSGVYLERRARDPARFLAQGTDPAQLSGGVRINLNQPMSRIAADCAKLRAGDLAFLSGPVVVARDMVHARLAELLAQGAELPPWFKDHPIFYAGPAKTPQGHVIGSFGPTTAGRMDAYIPAFMSQGASLVSIAKGNRSEAVRAACQRHGGTYLAAIGGAAALIAQENILSDELLDYPEFGMEAARLITLKDLPVFAVMDSAGGDLYQSSH